MCIYYLCLLLLADAGSPFIILLAIDPHVITKAIELNLNEVREERGVYYTAVVSMKH